MVCAVDSGPALDADVVDARFWALVGGDEGWLGAELGEFASGPVEVPTLRRPRCPVAVDREYPQPARPVGRGMPRGRRSERRDGDGLVRRQRSPPREGSNVGCSKEGVMRSVEVVNSRAVSNCGRPGDRRPVLGVRRSFGVIEY